MSDAAQNETPRPEPRLRRLDAEAKERGYPTTGAFLKWCLRRGIPVYQPDGRTKFVDANAVHAAIVGEGPARAPAPPAPRPLSKRSEIARAAERHAEKYRGR